MDELQSNDSQTTKHRCGLCCWRPRCLNGAANICAFLIAACFISCLQSAFSGYIASQVTTLEKRFAIGSSVIGYINGFFEVGYIISVIFVSYAGARGHVPRVISIALFVMAAGAVLWSLPHFIFPYAKTAVYIKATPINPLCSHDSKDTVDQNDQSSTCVQDQASGYGFLPILFLAQILIGSGSSPILTLIPPFIDDHVLASKAPRMIAAQYASAAMGPVFGFALGAVVLQYPADFLSSSPMEPDDPNFIGAWWTGFILFAILVMIGGLILMAFPHKLHQSGLDTNIPGTAPLATPENGIISILAARPNSSPNQLEPSPNHTGTTLDRLPDNSHATNQSEPRHFRCRPCSCSGRSTSRPRLGTSSNRERKFFKSVASLLRNGIYLVVCLGICSEMFMIIGFASFLPKYLEMEYQITKSSASMIAGGIIVPAGALGILVGGLILQRFSFRRRDAIKFVMVINALITGCIVAFYFLGCTNPPIAGVTEAYPRSNSNAFPSVFHWLINTGSLKPHFNLSNTCHADCNCDLTTWSPLCDDESGMSFASPCLAGCTSGSDESGVFTDCSCLADPSVSIHHGLCPHQCSRLVFFVIVLTICLFLTGVIQNPLIMVTMRSVSHHERSFALGLQFVIIRLLANLPSPMVFGRVIDEACLFWRFSCGRQGDCAYEDVRSLTVYMTSLGLIIKCIGFIFYGVLFYLLRSVPPTRNNGAPSAVSRFARKPSAPMTGPGVGPHSTVTNDE